MSTDKMKRNNNGTCFTFSGAFAHCRRLRRSFVISFRRSIPQPACISAAHIGQICMKFNILDFYKLSQNATISITCTLITKYFLLCPSTSNRPHSQHLQLKWYQAVSPSVRSPAFISASPTGRNSVQFNSADFHKHLSEREIRFD